MMPGALFVHGGAGNQGQYLARAREISALGCLCLTFDLYGHATAMSYQGQVTREDNLNDIVAAYIPSQIFPSSTKMLSWRSAAATVATSVQLTQHLLSRRREHF